VNDRKHGVAAAYSPPADTARQEKPVRLSSLRVVLPKTVTTQKELLSAEMELTAEETELFEILDAAAEETVSKVRISGGWVRDKALGRVKTKIEVALDNCSGVEFARAVVQVLETTLEEGCESRAHVQMVPSPDKTATMRVCGFHVHFISLRPPEDELGCPRAWGTLPGGSRSTWALRNRATTRGGATSR